MVTELCAELVADDQAQVGVGGENKEQKGDEEKNENWNDQCWTEIHFKKSPLRTWQAAANFIRKILFMFLSAANGRST